MKSVKREPVKGVEDTTWVVYLVECANQTVYTGIARNLERRIKQHNTKRGAKYTAMHGPVKLLYKEVHPDRSSATKREIQIKRWPRKKKLALIV